MDFLKAEIASKKRTLSPAEGSSNGNGQPASKYLRKGDIERIRKEEQEKAEQQRREEQDRKRKEKEAKIYASAKKVGLSIDLSPSVLATDILCHHLVGGSSRESGSRTSFIILIIQ